jgi:hypothetical protein
MSVGDVIEDGRHLFGLCARPASVRLSGSERGVRQMGTNRAIPCKRHNPIRKALRSPHLRAAPVQGPYTAI